MSALLTYIPFIMAITALIVALHNILGVGKQKREEDE